MKKYYQVHGYSKANFASFDSPKFETYKECEEWISEQFFDPCMELEIREVKATQIDHSTFDKFDVSQFESDSLISKIMLTRGCIGKAFSEYYRIRN